MNTAGNCQGRQNHSRNDMTWLPDGERNYALLTSAVCHSFGMHLSWQSRRRIGLGLALRGETGDACLSLPFSSIDKCKTVERLPCDHLR